MGCRWSEVQILSPRPKFPGNHSPGSTGRRRTCNNERTARQSCRAFPFRRPPSLPILRILLSNDDGYFAPGLAALADALSQLAEIVVVAPERDRSGASNSLTLDLPLQVRRASGGFFYVNGTPTDC